MKILQTVSEIFEQLKGLEDESTMFQFGENLFLVEDEGVLV